jgi:hypothetical protein
MDVAGDDFDNALLARLVSGQSRGQWIDDPDVMTSHRQCERNVDVGLKVDFVDDWNNDHETRSLEGSDCSREIERHDVSGRSIFRP